MIVYLDTSALAKLVLDEPGSDDAAQLWRDATIRFTSMLAYVELRSAFASAVRAGRVRHPEASRGRGALEDYWAEMTHVDVDEPIVGRAGELAERHALRAYDAVHLATAAGAAEGGDVVFVTWDRALAEAANSDGLAVAPPL